MSDTYTLYNPTVMDHFMNPRNMGDLKDADGVGEVGAAACGDIMKISLKIKDGKIEDARFKTFGCGSAIASSSNKNQKSQTEKNSSFALRSNWPTGTGIHPDLLVRHQKTSKGACLPLLPSGFGLRLCLIRPGACKHGSTAVFQTGTEWRMPSGTITAHI